MQVKNEECLLLLATYTKYSRKTHSQTVSTTQVEHPPQPPLIIVKQTSTKRIKVLTYGIVLANIKGGIDNLLIKLGKLNSTKDE